MFALRPPSGRPNQLDGKAFPARLGGWAGKGLKHQAGASHVLHHLAVGVDWAKPKWIGTWYSSR